ncbi:MAG TPA: phosphoribosylamine--glycine ligase, partial [Caulobacteraceae bacterium]|nr:phosphoribosylamine--glycine ligase [Caulobacteraceae bacterium]
TAAAGRLESSKAFTKAFCDRHHLPTSGYRICDDAPAAKAALAHFQPPYVVKADGLAAGKGVVIAPDLAAGARAVRDMLDGRFGAAGARVVIEEFMAGEEVSLFALSDGTDTIAFGSAQDHKRAFDGDEGPNTGGMGTYSPVPALSPALEAQAMERIVTPTIEGLAAEGAPFRGALFAGLMLTPAGPRLIEFNARFGDPETQVLMLRLEDDLLPYLEACAAGTLKGMAQPRWRSQSAVCVVVAAKGYPDAPHRGARIQIPDEPGEGVVVFHSGTGLEDGHLIAAGGRVLNVCALGADLAEARARAYAALDRIVLPGGFHRRDIGWRALPRTQT